MKQTAVLWAGILTGPLVWFLHLETSFALASTPCSGRNRLALVALSVPWRPLY
jgi:hypothetical protein